MECEATCPDAVMYGDSVRGKGNLQVSGARGSKRTDDGSLGGREKAGAELPKSERVDGRSRVPPQRPSVARFKEMTRKKVRGIWPHAGLRRLDKPSSLLQEVL